MPVRLFSRIKIIATTKKALHRMPKAFLLSGMLFMMVFGNSLPVFAQANQPVDHTYDEYKTLFSSGGIVGNPIPLVNFTTNKIDGVWIKFKLNFSDNPSHKWALVGDPVPFRFILRNCDATKLDQNGNPQESFCLYSPVIPYVDHPGDEKSFFTQLAAISQIGSNPYKEFLAAYLLNDGIQRTNAIQLFLKHFGDTYHLNLLTSDGYIIYRKIGSDLVKNQTVDLFAVGGQGNWFTIKSNGSTDNSFNYSFTPGEKRSVSIWYLPNKADNNSINPQAAGTSANGQNPDPSNIQVFRGTSYFRATPEVPYTVQSLSATAATQAGTDQQSGSRETEKDTLPGCDILNGSWLSGEGSFMGCIAQLVYYAIYVPIAWFAGIMGNLFDFFIGYTLDDASYRADFVVTAWKVIRDISNIFFILILVWTGLAAVFDIKSVQMKKVIPSLIINALLINFSLFGVRLVVDISNIFANIFYNRINTTVTKDGQTISTDRSGVGGYKPLSGKLIEGFNPQRIFAARNASLAQYNARISSDNQLYNGSVITSSTDLNVKSVVDHKETTTVDINSTRYANYYILISILAAIIMFGVAVMFWKTAFFFLGRVIGIYITMIFAPFALLTRGSMPIVGSIPKLKWADWAKELVDYALLAPIFVFFLYVVYLLVNSKFLESSLSALNQPESGFFATVLSIAIPMLIIFYMIREGSKLAEKYSGEAGGIVQQYLSGAANKIGGFAVGAGIGVATGGAAVLGRNVLGRLGQRMSRSQTLQNASASGRWYSGLANKAIGVGQGMSQASYDARNLKVSQGIRNRAAEFGITGAGMNNRLLGALNANRQQTQGGFQAAVQRETQRLTRRADRFQLTGIQATQQDELNRTWESDYQRDRTTAQQAAITANQVFDEVDFRQNYINQRANTVNARPETAAEINRQREENFGAAMRRGSYLAQLSRTVTNRITTPTAVGGVAGAVAGAPIIGGIAATAAGVVGEGAIQNEAQLTVANQRRNLSRDPISATQRTNMNNELNRLNGELTRIVQLLTAIGQNQVFQPPIAYDQLTQANLIDYRNYLNQQLVGVRQQISSDEDFIRNNQNSTNPATIAAVQNRRNTLTTNRQTESGLQGNIRESNTILNEYNRVNGRIRDIRTQLGV